MNWEALLQYVAGRLREPSTYVSLGVMATGLGFQIAPDKWQAISSICLGVGGLAGILLQEKKTSAVEIKNVVQAVVKDTALEPAPPPAHELEKIKTNGGA